MTLPDAGEPTRRVTQIRLVFPPTVLVLRCAVCRAEDLLAGGRGRADLVGRVVLNSEGQLAAIRDDQTDSGLLGQHSDRRQHTADLIPIKFERVSPDALPGLQFIRPPEKVRFQCRHGSPPHRLRATEPTIRRAIRRGKTDAFIEAV